MNQQERAAALDRALAVAVPASRGWERETAADGGSTWSTVAPSGAAPGDRRLEVDLRPDGDVDVRFHYGAPHRATGRGPAEAHFLVATDGEADAFGAVARFVADLLDERLVLALRRGWFRGGREFLAPGGLTPERRRPFERVVSWRGSYDWPAAQDRTPPRAAG